jgi:signal transduction histidine kinase
LPLFADPVQLRIAVQNLLDNALEHNSRESGPVSIALHAEAKYLEIAVADTGKGISDDKKATLFTRFAGEDGFTRGVGLSIVQRIAHNHGGEALVRDNQPCGTVMKLRLPRNR